MQNKKKCSHPKKPSSKKKTHKILHEGSETIATTK